MLNIMKDADDDSTQVVSQAKIDNKENQNENLITPIGEGAMEVAGFTEFVRPARDENKPKYNPQITPSTDRGAHGSYTEGEESKVSKADESEQINSSSD